MILHPIFERFSADNFDNSWAQFLWKVESAFWHQLLALLSDKDEILLSTPSSDIHNNKNAKYIWTAHIHFTNAVISISIMNSIANSG